MANHWIDRKKIEVFEIYVQCQVLTPIFLTPIFSAMSRADPVSFSEAVMLP